MMVRGVGSYSGQGGRNGRKGHFAPLAPLNFEKGHFGCTFFGGGGGGGSKTPMLGNFR